MTSVRRGLAGLLAYVRPTFMLPAVGMALYGAALAPLPTFEWPIAALHAATVGLALLVAHLRDGYVDGHQRGEETPRLDVGAFRWSIGIGSVAVLLLSAVLAARAGVLAGLSTTVLLLLALSHAPYLDRHPVTVTADYPVGIATALVGGYAAQTAGVESVVALTALLFVGFLSGVKIGIDRLDRAFDASIGKRTVPVVLGTRGAERAAVAVFLFTASATAALGVAGYVELLPVRPLYALVAALAPLAGLVATVALRAEWVVRVQMASSYVFAVGLFAAVCSGGCVGSEIAHGALEALL
ncbi:hypothetical protein [Halobellus rufus]|uniref:hypothetical protein n=1 Tax=Halobellus rufus TaxID=1448860 RepID=UPI00067870D9|nr:hypothetical protein [Halobellus rufus]